MQELLDIAIPAVVLVPLIIVGAAVWLCLRQNARASELRRAKFLMLKRKTQEEQERAEREFEEEYSRNRQPDYRVDYRRRPAAENLYQKRVEVKEEPWGNVDAQFYRSLLAEEETQRRKLIDSEDSNRRRKEEEKRTKQTEIEEYNRKIQEEELRRRQADAEEYNRRKQEDELRRREAEAAEYNRRLQAEEEIVRKRQAEAEERKQREAAEQEFSKRRQEEEEEKKRQAEIAARARAEAEEIIRKKQRDDEASRKGLEEEKSLKQDVVRHVERKLHSESHLLCAVCQQPTKRRCSRCKSVFYCSRVCQLRHWNEGHKNACRIPDSISKNGGRIPDSSSSLGSSESDSRNFSDVLSPRSTRSDNISDTLSVDEIIAPQLSPALSPAPGFLTTANSHSAPVSPQPGSLLKTSSTVSADGRRTKPKKILFPYAYFVELFNRKISFPPCGLYNCGNSCFANVVLQCLTYTQPLAAYLLEGVHSEHCRRSDWCFLCELQQHIAKVQQSRSPLSPVKILNRIRNIGSHLGYGKQEDAHEFMSFAINSMQSIFLDEVGGAKAVDACVQGTTLIQYIFGGQLQSQVKCMQCLHESNRYENMMDLAVEIQGNVESLEDALAQFTAPEKLQGDNKYKCDRCNSYVEACKQITVHEAPNILIVTLKRFKSGRFGKLNKPVHFSEDLDLMPYMSANGDRPPHYKLYAVVVHVDIFNASYFGHYICLVKNSRGSWYQADDAKVTEVDWQTLRTHRAYILLYRRSSARLESFTDDSGPQSITTAQYMRMPERYTVPSEATYIRWFLAYPSPLSPPTGL